MIGDHAVTLTIAFFPLALVSLPVSNLLLFVTVLCFVASMAVLYAAFIHIGSRRKAHGFERWQVVVLALALVVYLAVVLFWVLDVL